MLTAKKLRNIHQHNIIWPILEQNLTCLCYDSQMSTMSANMVKESAELSSLKEENIRISALLEEEKRLNNLLNTQVTSAHRQLISIYINTKKFVCLFVCSGFSCYLEIDWNTAWHISVFSPMNVITKNNFDRRLRLIR